jgi:hypothetical protein
MFLDEVKVAFDIRRAADPISCNLVSLVRDHRAGFRFTCVDIDKSSGAALVDQRSRSQAFRLSHLTIAPQHLTLRLGYCPLSTRERA